MPLPIVKTKTMTFNFDLQTDKAGKVDDFHQDKRATSLPTVSKSALGNTMRKNYRIWCNSRSQIWTTIHSKLES